MAAKILSVEISDDVEPSLVFRLGTSKIVKPFPAAHSLVRMSAIMDEKGVLTDVEVVTQKV